MRRTGRESGVGAGERDRDLGAVRLMPDGCEWSGELRHEGMEAVDGRSGCQTWVGVKTGARCTCDCLGRLAGAEQRAREHDHRRHALRCEPLTEALGQLGALRRQRARLVGFPWRGLGMSAEVDAHERQG